MGEAPSYIDSSALVKVVVDEPESEALRRHVTDHPHLVTSALSLLEVTRTVRGADPALESEARRLLQSCIQVAISDAVLASAQRLVGPALRSLDAIHLATALHVPARSLIAYDRRLIAAAQQSGLEILRPA